MADDSGISVWVGLAGIIIAAVIAAGGTVLGSRWASRNERTRLRQELVTITGTDRERLAAELDRVRARANEVDEELESVRDERRALADEYAQAKIEHRIAIAEKDETQREALAEKERLHRAAMLDKDTAYRSLELQLQAAQNQLAESQQEMSRCRMELNRRGDMIQAQGQIIEDWRVRYHINATPPLPLPPPPLSNS